MPGRVLIVDDIRPNITLLEAKLTSEYYDVIAAENGHKAIELAWLWLRHQPDSALSLWFRTRTVNAGKRAKRIAIVALARKLIVALWRYITTGLVPEQAIMKT